MGALAALLSAITLASGSSSATSPRPTITSIEVSGKRATITWTPVDVANEYYVELSTKRTMDSLGSFEEWLCDPCTNARVPSTLTSWTTSTLPPGRYYVHVAAETDFLQDESGEWSDRWFSAVASFAIRDVEAPRVRARRSTGVVGRKVALVWRINDASRVRHEIRVYSGARVIYRVGDRKFFRYKPGSYQHAWQSPRGGGAFRFCVRATDEEQNKSKWSCAPIVLRKAGAGGGGQRCDRAYPTVCIAPPPPDLDCADILHRNFRVVPPDPHRFDGNRDGIGCEG